ncbi:MAG: hypothetical protein QOG34_2572 [Frankiaceae bacterium]|jgi:hypothetical protein|nr:hypothetical protein [Frankiaceae bacterium]
MLVGKRGGVHSAFGDATTNAVVVPAVAAVASVLVRLATLPNQSKGRAFWDVFAFGTDLLIASAVAIPALLAGEAAGINAVPHARGTEITPATLESKGYVLIGIIGLILLGVTVERLWSQPARGASGWRRPLLVGILPCAGLGAGSLAMAFTLGLS